MRISIIIIFFATISIEMTSQTGDTIIDKKLYKYRSYYPSSNSRKGFDDDKNQPLLSLGNIIYNEKAGHWIYFLQNGKKFAEGTYKNGKKIGKWLYYKGNEKEYKTLKYSKENNLLDQIFVDEFGHLEIRDITAKYNQTIYVNGSWVESNIRFVD